MVRESTLLCLVLLPVSLLADVSPRANPSAATPPVCPHRSHPMSLHGDSWNDQYFWLKDKNDSETIKYLEAENAYTQAVMKPLVSFEDKLYKEMLGRIKQTDLSVPYQHRGWWYYSRNEEGKQYGIRCRKRGNLDAKEEVILDGNDLAKGKKFMGVGALAISDDGNLAAYAVDFTGFRIHDVFVKDLRTGKLLSDRPLVQADQVVWAGDNKTLFYVTQDHAKRPNKVWRHVLGIDKHDLVHEEKDELYSVRVQKSRDDAYVFLHCNSSDTDQYFIIPANHPELAPKPLLPREKGHEYSVGHRDGKFWLTTNKDAKNYRVVTAPNQHPEQWTEVIAHRPAVYIDGVTLFSDYAVVREHEKGLPQIAIHDLKNGGSHRIAMPEPVYSVFPDANPEFNASKLRFHYQSLVTPDSVIEYDMAKRDRKTLKQTEVLGGYDPSKYASERIEAKASDGTMIPISLVYRKDLKKDGTAGCLLTGYGAYGSSAPVTFSSSNLSLLDRGLVFAEAHIRGGKELGQHWHDQGKMMNKRNTFTDFIACADHLVNQKYCARDRMAIRGGSAGGLLMGAVVNLRPDLCKAVILDVPFVDVITTMLDESIPLTVGEFLEWGNPKIKSEYEYMKSYCPYTNLKKCAYPAMLVTTSLNDSQVLYTEPTKYVARLRTLKSDKNPLLFKCNMAGGHGGSSGRYDNLREQAFRFAFLLDQIGINS